MSSSVPISLSNAAVTAALAGSSSSSGLVNRFSEIENPPKSDDFTATNTNNDRPRSFSHSVNYSDSYSKANNSFSFSTQPVTDDIISVSGWVENEKKLLALEFKYESEQLADKISHLSAKECEKLGLSLLALKIVAVKSSLFGRFSISLESNRLKNKVIERFSFKPGDEVILRSLERKPNDRNTTSSVGKSFSSGDSETISLNGVVSKVYQSVIEIVSESSPEEIGLPIDSPCLRMDLRTNEYTHRKMIEALENLNQDRSHPLIPLLFNQIEIPQHNMKNLHSFPEGSRSNHISYNFGLDVANKNLNESQLQAVRGALEASYVSIIHGPPGTGKTSTVRCFTIYIFATPIFNHWFARCWIYSHFAIVTHEFSSTAL